MSREKDVTMAVAYVVFLLIVVIIGLAWTWSGRETPKPGGKTIVKELPANCAEVISVSSGGLTTYAMVTYRTVDGEIITQDYKPWGLFQCKIIWHQHKQRTTNAGSDQLAPPFVEGQPPGSAR